VIQVVILASRSMQVPVAGPGRRGGDAFSPVPGVAGQATPHALRMRPPIFAGNSPSDTLAIETG
jgi:hypothetical protein